MDEVQPFNCEKNILEIYQCKQCEYKTNIGISLCDHFQKSHLKNKKNPFSYVWANEGYSCKNCKFSTFSFVFLFKHYLTCHKNIKNRTQPVVKNQCPYCLQKLSQTSKLKEHIIRKHTAPEKIVWYSCDKCSYKGKLKADLAKHKKTVHNGANLNIQMLAKYTTQENLPQYECTTCKFKTVYKQQLETHFIRRHTIPDETQWYQCEHCIYKTKIKSDLRRHVKLHHMPAEENVPKYECTICPFIVKRKGALTSHIIRCHTDPLDVEWYQCEHCSYKNKIKSVLTRHLKVKHKVNQEDK